jgi:hypothetical protein
MTTKKELPKDRAGDTLHFRILVRDEDRHGVATVRTVGGHLHLNKNPDGTTLREIFARTGKAGSGEAWLDEWAKQVNARLQDGRSVEQVFRTHVGTRFGDSGMVQGVREVTSCTSILDLIARIVISRFGTQETL